jgi:hypothetical protein
MYIMHVEVRKLASSSVRKRDAKKAQQLIEECEKFRAEAITKVDTLTVVVQQLTEKVASLSELQTCMYMEVSELLRELTRKQLETNTALSNAERAAKDEVTLRADVQQENMKQYQNLLPGLAQQKVLFDIEKDKYTEMLKKLEATNQDLIEKQAELDDWETSLTTVHSWDSVGREMQRTCQMKGCCFWL